MKGTLITFEGIDCSGKTTQIQLLADWLSHQGIPYIQTREPDGSLLGIDLRETILSQEMAPIAEAFLFLAARAELYAILILPQLELGKVVLVDRGPDSTLAYQGFGKQVGIDFLKHLNVIATKGREPDLTFLLDIEANKALKRKETGHDRLENLELLARARAAYISLAMTHDKRFRVIRADDPKDAIHSRIVNLVKMQQEQAMVINLDDDPDRWNTKGGK